MPKNYFLVIVLQVHMVIPGTLQLKLHFTLPVFNQARDLSGSRLNINNSNVFILDILKDHLSIVINIHFTNDDILQYYFWFFVLDDVFMLLEHNVVMMILQVDLELLSPE